MTSGFSFVAQGAHGRPNYANSGATDPQDLRSAQCRLKQAAQRTGLGGQVPPIASALSHNSALLCLQIGFSVQIRAGSGEAVTDVSAGRCAFA